MNTIGIQPVAKEEFDKLSIKVPYYRNRWEYYSVAQRMVMVENPKSVLEIGASYPIFNGSETLGLPWDKRALIKHDIRIIPWPLEDKQYDFVVALQVWEYIGPQQEEAFQEVMRVSNRAVLSFPLGWKSCKPDDDHFNITEETISQWTLGLNPIARELIGGRDKRLVLAFDFTKKDNKI